MNKDYIDKNGIRCFLDSNGKIYKADIMEFTSDVKNTLEQNQIKEIYYENPDCFVDRDLLIKMSELEYLQLDVRAKPIEATFANKIKKLKRFGAGKITGCLDSSTIERIGYTWHKKSDISKSTNINYIWVANCSDIELFMSQITKLKNLKQIIFFKISSSVFSRADEGTTVEELEFSYCPRLLDLENFPSNFPNLTHLKFDHCKNIQDYSALAKLKDLEELIIFESAPIADLSFLKEMKKLSLLKIFKTKITAKNTEVLDEIPAKVDLLFTGIK